MGFPLRSGFFAIVRDIYFNINRTFSANTILLISHLLGFAVCDLHNPIQVKEAPSQSVENGPADLRISHSVLAQISEPALAGLSRTMSDDRQRSGDTI